MNNELKSLRRVYQKDKGEVCSIKDYAFRGCSMLRTFAVISRAVKSNFEKIFAGCDSLTSLYVEDAYQASGSPYHFKSLKYLYSTNGSNFVNEGSLPFSSDCNLRKISTSEFDTPEYKDDPEYTFWASLF